MALIGAVTQGSGSLVRVFAPNANSVRVYGDWNDWNEATAMSLAPGGDGFWEGQVAGLVASDRYELLAGRDGTSFNHRLDPAARDTDSSSLDNWHNKSQVVDTSHVWSPFNTPSFDDLILYQSHVGSFSGYRDDHVATGGVASFDHLRTKLDYIRGLGFNTLALPPVQEFRFNQSWGYNPAFYFALESAYGRSWSSLSACLGSLRSRPRCWPS